MNDEWITVIEDGVEYQQRVDNGRWEDPVFTAEREKKVTGFVMLFLLVLCVFVSWLIFGMKGMAVVIHLHLLVFIVAYKLAEKRLLPFAFKMAHAWAKKTKEQRSKQK